MIELTESVYIPALIVIITAVVTAVIIDYASKLTGRDVKADIDTVIDLLDKIQKAAEDGKITDDEFKVIQEATLIAKESIKPYIDIISESGILCEILHKIKGWLS